MSIALDGHATGGNSASASTTVTLTTVNANDIIVVQAVGVNASGAITVSSVTGGGLTFVKRKSLVFGTNDTLEVWWAVAAAPLSGVVITVNWSSSVTAANVAALCAFGIAGADTLNPWDPNPTFPATAVGSNSIPTVAGLSTNNPKDVLLGFSAELASLTETAGTGYTLIDSTTQAATVTAADQFQIVNSVQSGVSEAFGVTTTASWSMIADALQQAFAYTTRAPVYTLRIQPVWYQHWAQNLVVNPPPPPPLINPFIQTDWPLTPAPRRGISLDTWLASGVSYIGKDKLPFRQFYWPLTPAAVRQADLGTWLTSSLRFLGKDKLPTRISDWPVPQGVTWYKDWSQNFALTGPVVATGVPFSQDDWPTPPRAPWYRDWYSTECSLV